MGFDCGPAEVTAGRDAFMPWLHSLGNSFEGQVRVQELQSNVIRSFDAFELEGLGLWLLHNKFASTVGVVPDAPKAGFAYAVDQEFVRLDVPDFLRGWGPIVPSAIDLNADLTDAHWQLITTTDRAYADKFKPTKLSHVLFNYWD